MTPNLEIERKYLIAMPDVDFLKAQPGCVVWEIEQIYLKAIPGMTRRVRSVLENGKQRWFRTFKRRIDALTAEEDESEIGCAEYCALLREADELCRPVRKLRCRIPYEGQLLEFDIYPFWSDRAVMEVELDSEDQQVLVPEWVRVLKDVTDDVRYKNVRLAQSVPMDEI